MISLTKINRLQMVSESAYKELTADLREGCYAAYNDDSYNDNIYRLNELYLANDHLCDAVLYQDISSNSYRFLVDCIRVGDLTAIEWYMPFLEENPPQYPYLERLPDSRTAMEVSCVVKQPGNALQA